jgi:site-specific DNA recombinase
MATVHHHPGGDLLAGWTDDRLGRPRRSARATTPVARGGLRFAFYGRISTEDYQDPASSRAWQREVAAELIVGRGRIVGEFFDVGYSRRRAWADRPQAAALLAALAGPDRVFDAVVVGEYERAFCAHQLRQLVPVLARRGVALWLPEAQGPFDPDSPEHQALITLLGARSKHEVLRARFRVRAAMQAQVREQGRFLGGRPPYGYRLVDAGPHPNAAHARWGRRLHRLEPDPATAGYVRWMFARRLAGHSVASIARALNEQGVACPSGVDLDRNRHRSGAGWALRTVASILANPRYTGRQVWNRQRVDHDPQNPAGPCGGEVRVQRWNPKDQWVISRKRVHTALVSEEDFVAAQAISAVAAPADGTVRTYLLVGLLRCRACGRRLESHWVHGRPGYRCRHGHTSATPRPPSRRKPVYLREDQILARITSQLVELDPTGAAGDATCVDDPAALAGFLRAHDIEITCDADACTLDTRSSS